MRKLITTKTKAQNAANKCHAYLIANNNVYAASVEAGQTTSWCIPQQYLLTDEEGNQIPNANAPWFIWVSDECEAALTQAEQALLS